MKNQYKWLLKVQRIQSWKKKLFSIILTGHGKCTVIKLYEWWLNTEVPKLWAAAHYQAVGCWPLDHLSGWPVHACVCTRTPTLALVSQRCAGASVAQVLVAPFYCAHNHGPFCVHACSPIHTHTYVRVKASTSPLHWAANQERLGTPDLIA